MISRNLASPNIWRRGSSSSTFEIVTRKLLEIRSVMRRPSAIRQRLSLATLCPPPAAHCRLGHGAVEPRRRALQPRPSAFLRAQSPKSAHLPTGGAWLPFPLRPWPPCGRRPSPRGQDLARERFLHRVQRSAPRVLLQASR